MPKPLALLAGAALIAVGVVAFDRFNRRLEEACALPAPVEARHTVVRIPSNRALPHLATYEWLRQNFDTAAGDPVFGPYGEATS